MELWGYLSASREAEEIELTKTQAQQGPHLTSSDITSATWKQRTHQCKALDTVVKFSESSDFLIGVGKASTWEGEPSSTACVEGN